MRVGGFFRCMFEDARESKASPAIMGSEEKSCGAPQRKSAEKHEGKRATNKQHGMRFIEKSETILCDVKKRRKNWSWDCQGLLVFSLRLSIAMCFVH